MEKKKWILAVLTALLLFSLFACRPAEPQESEAENELSEESAPSVPRELAIFLEDGWKDREKSFVIPRDQTAVIQATLKNFEGFSYDPLLLLKMRRLDNAFDYQIYCVKHIPVPGGEDLLEDKVLAVRVTLDNQAYVLGVRDLTEKEKQ